MVGSRWGVGAGRDHSSSEPTHRSRCHRGVSHGGRWRLHERRDETARAHTAKYSRDHGAGRVGLCDVVAPRDGADRGHESDRWVGARSRPSVSGAPAAEDRFRGSPVSRRQRRDSAARRRPVRSAGSRGCFVSPSTCSCWRPAPTTGYGVSMWIRPKRMSRQSSIPCAAPIRGRRSVSCRWRRRPIWVRGTRARFTTCTRRSARAEGATLLPFLLRGRRGRAGAEPGGRDAPQRDRRARCGGRTVWSDSSRSCGRGRAREWLRRMCAWVAPRSAPDQRYPLTMLAMRRA